MANERRDLVKACKVLSIADGPNGKKFVRCVVGVPPLGDSVTHEFEFFSKQAIRDGIEITEDKFTELDLCHMVLQPALKADPNLGEAAINARVGKTFTIDLTGAQTAFTQS